MIVTAMTPPSTDRENQTLPKNLLKMQNLSPSPDPLSQNLNFNQGNGMHKAF